MRNPQIRHDLVAIAKAVGLAVVAAAILLFVVAVAAQMLGG